MTCGIYMIRNIVNGKMYIGQAIDIECDRWKQHRAYLKGGYHTNKHLQNDWNKYGEENFEFSILLECEESQLNTYEEYYIFELMTYNPKVGYNKTYGGNSGRPTEEYRKKLSEANKGRILSDGWRKKISEANKGKHLSKEHKRKISEANKGENNPNYGKPLSEEHKKKLSEAHKGKQHTEETKKKMSESRKGENNPKSKTVVQIDLNTNEIINIYFSANEAARLTGFNQSAISKCCRSEQKTHKGFKWMYLEDYNKLNKEN